MDTYEKKYNEALDFKTKLAEYMMKNRTGYSYSISSESILEMAKEELIKRGELQKPAEWSEEDERLAEEALDMIKSNGGWVRSDDAVKQVSNWFNNRLKSLRPVKQELSEKDRKILDDVSHILAGLNYKQVAQDYKQAVENLLSLRPQWKPTEEQMKALNWARCLIFETYTDKHVATEPYHILGELYDQLKKLKDGTDTND